MNSFLIYLLKSSLCMSLLYLLFRAVMRKESFFALNRILLIAIILFSSIIPLLYLPNVTQSSVKIEQLPVFAHTRIGTFDVDGMRPIDVTENTISEKTFFENANRKMLVPWPQMFQYLYLAGLLISFLILLNGIFSIIVLLKQAKYIKMDGFKLLILEREISAFSFGRLVILSQNDYDVHKQTLLAHEQAHIRFKHFYDLLLVETAKIIHWFNPSIYWIAKDMKEIHEFQADNYTLNKGIDATQYQLLIIQKCVGSQRFTLANSFNHYQIKKRIVMMNNEKTSKAWRWKVAIFLPVLALLLMAFGRGEEISQPGKTEISSVGKALMTDAKIHWSEADFVSIEGLNLLTKLGKTPNWKEPSFGTYKMDGEWRTYRSPYFGNFNVCSIQLDSKSQLWMNNHSNPLKWKDMQDIIRAYFDYELANDKTKPFFHACLVSGVEKMSPQCMFSLIIDKDIPSDDYQKLLDIIGNTILEIREKYSKDVYNMRYAQLSAEQREQINIVVPLICRNFIKSPIIRQVTVVQNDTVPSEPDMEYKADGKITIEGGNTHIVLSHNAQLKYRGVVLKADYIDLNKAADLVYATGIVDSSGIMTGTPVIKIDDELITADTIFYNFNNKKGAIYSSRTVSKF
ncbi:MAG: M56 family metallopeptidase [Marinilabiliales bacterium]|nr:M56 family metallopeptidase [Marinilabiliales bacterium]